MIDRWRQRIAERLGQDDIANPVPIPQAKRFGGLFLTCGQRLHAASDDLGLIAGKEQSVADDHAIQLVADGPARKDKGQDDGKGEHD